MAKIDPYLNSIAIGSQNFKPTKKEKSKTRPALFSEILKKKSETENNPENTASVDFSGEEFDLQREQIPQVMEQIKELGKQLITFKSYNDLLRYRNLIKNFIRFYVKNSMELQVINPSRNPFAPSRDKKVMVEMIDQKLEELTLNFLALHQKPLALLKEVELIQGLLLDLQA